MLLRSAAVGLMKPKNFSVISSFPLSRNFSVQKPVSNRILVNCPRVAVFNFGTQTQLRHLSLSGHRLNTSPEATQEVLDSVVANIAKSEPEAVVSELIDELIFEIPAKPEILPDAAAATAADPGLIDTTASNELIFEIPAKPEIAPDAVATAADPGLSDITASNELVFDIPDKPIPLDLPELLGEPAFDTLGLASWWPSGRMQYLMENLHIGLELEWWQTIALTTLMMRFVLFPAVVMAQRNMANMGNHTPQMAALQDKMSDARRRGDLLESAMLGQELSVFMKKKGINPLTNALPIMMQVPVFMSFFFGLRGMANCPVESMTTGGLYWFENLTLADPFYLLPILTSSTLYLQLRLGAEGAKLDQMGPKMKIAMTVLPFIMLPITINFPTAVNFYWFTTNIISLCQARMLKIPVMRKALKIPIMIKHEPKDLAPGGRKKGFQEGFRDTIDNWKVQGNIIDRRVYDEQQFKEAGAKKPIKTFKYDPTKPVALNQFKK